MKKTSKNIYLLAVYIGMSLNPVRTTAQNTYSGSYSIQSHYQFWEGNSEAGIGPHNTIRGIAKYNYIEKKEQRIYHGPFKFSTIQSSKNFLPKLIDIETDSVTIIGSFNNGKKNGLWTIRGYHDENIGKVSIEMTFNNGVIDGPVKGYSSIKNNEICSFNYSFTNGKLNGPFQINFFDEKVYEYKKIHCLFNFNNGLFDGNNTISFFDNNNKEFKLQRQYDNGLLKLDKYQDLSTGEYIVNQKYNIDLSPPHNTDTIDFDNKFRAAALYESFDGYHESPFISTDLLNEYFTLLNDISKGKGDEIASFGYYHTSNSEILKYPEPDTVYRIFRNDISYISDKDRFLRESLPNYLWYNAHIGERNRRNKFVEVPNYEANTITPVNNHVFDLMNIIFIFPLGQDSIEIKPIIKPYIFFSKEAEELYTSFRMKYLYMDSINGFKQDSLRFRSEINNHFSSLNSDEPTLHRQLIIYYFKHGIRFGVEEMENALTRQFQKIKKIDQEISDQSNFKFSSEDLRIKQDSIFHHYQGIQIRLKQLNNILSIRDNPDLLFILSPNATTASLKFQSQIQKLFEIPGANERFSEDRQFTFRPDQSTEDELNEILLIINERKWVYSKIYKNEIRVNPKKYATIDEFLKDLKTM